MAWLHDNGDENEYSQFEEDEGGEGRSLSGGAAISGASGVFVGGVRVQYRELNAAATIGPGRRRSERAYGE